MESTDRNVLLAFVNSYDRLSEYQKGLGGLDLRDASRVIAHELVMEQALVDAPEFEESEAALGIDNIIRDLGGLELVKAKRHAPGVINLSPTPLGRDEANSWQKEKTSPVAVGKRLLQYLYEHQQDEDDVMRREGIVKGIKVAYLCETLGIDKLAYRRAFGWAQRQGYADVLREISSSVEGGDVYITNEGMSAVDSDFRPANNQAGQTIDIHDITVAGDLLVAGQNAIKITSPELSASADEIRHLLQEIQEAIHTLAKEDDDYHDSRQELESLQREFSKKSPTPGRIERSLDAIGSLASIGGLAAPHIARLVEIAGQLPG